MEFMGAFRATFDYLGMHFGGMAHVNCHDGFKPELHDPTAVAFATLVRRAEHGQGTTGSSGSAAGTR